MFHLEANSFDRREFFFREVEDEATTDVQDIAEKKAVEIKDTPG